jgi:C-terminal processing protease CtpA/Prc
VKNSPIVLTTATLLVASAGLIAPGTTFAADSVGTESASVDAEQDTAAASKDAEHAARDAGKAARNADKATHEISTATDANTGDLDAKLAEARARLEQAAHEVAELSQQLSGPLMEKFMTFNGEGPPRAVLGVQLDTDGHKGGARIQAVSPGGPAAEAGLHVGDVIVAINDTDLKGDDTARQVLHLMHDVAPDSKVKVRVLREGKSRDFVVTSRPGMAFAGMHEHVHPPGFPGMPGHEMGDFHFDPPIMIRGPLGQMELATLTPQLGSYFGTDKGVLVVRAPKDDGFKLEEGDVILAIDGREPTSGSHATRILGSYQPGEKITIKLMRQHKTMNVETTLPERMMGPGPGPGSDRKVRMTRKDEAPT